MGEVHRELPVRGLTELQDMSIAFKNSNYATPYGDNTIPGNHPGHRSLRLGRDYAPDPITKSSLANDLHVPGNGLGPSGHVYPNDLNNVQHTLCLRGVEGGNYVLDSANGGRRHFDELRGYESEWTPSLRQLSPPVPESLARGQRRRGFGRFNPAVGGVEGKNVSSEFHKGKAIVPRPPDHDVVDLGLAHHHGIASTHTATTVGKGVGRSVDPWGEDPAAPLPISSSSAEGNNSNSNSGRNSGNGVCRRMNPVFLPSLPLMSPATDETRLRWDYLGTRRQPIVISDTGRASIYAERQRQKAAAQIREEDIQLVRSLPK
ncbi:uncharacterized protein TM35_000301510 [Trypanosoma theileri]|uniref:Uncharacterized protein n=1 Tax=Trypanosoma theileri TaxID=67003 RepID=A0A1X0NND0_9TRYP|nr:uncharacterized protein TM35_000301510 [Trypanosoma theileri]ORC86111.1 hypothetical protein TM35_000301510 [Trypanosoma theileri]